MFDQMHIKDRKSGNSHVWDCMCLYLAGGNILPTNEAISKYYLTVINCALCLLDVCIANFLPESSW